MSAVAHHRGALMAPTTFPAPQFRDATITQQRGSTSAPRSLEAPTARVAGDLLLLWILEGSAVTVGTPGAGWTIASGGSDDAPLGTQYSRSRLYSKAADGTSGDNAAWTVGGATTRRQAIMLALATTLRTVTAGQARSGEVTNPTMTTSITPGDVANLGWGHAVDLYGGWAFNSGVGNHDPAVYEGMNAGDAGPPAGWARPFDLGPGGSSSANRIENVDDNTNGNGNVRAGWLYKAVVPGTVTAPASNWSMAAGMQTLNVANIIAVLTP